MPRRPRGTPPQNRPRRGRGDRPRPHPEAAAPPAGLATKLAELIAAAFPGVLVASDEPDEVLRDLARLCGERNWNLATWTADGGEEGPADPLAAVKALPASGDGETPSVLAMVHAHRFFQSAELLAAVRTTLSAGKTRRTHLVLVQPSTELPPELRRDFALVDHPAAVAGGPGHGRPRRRDRAGGTAGPDQPGAGRRGRPHTVGGGERLRPLPSPARATRSRPAVGTEGPPAEERRPSDPAPRRAGVRRPRRDGRPQGVLPDGPDERVAGRRGQGHFAPRPRRGWQEQLRPCPRIRGEPPDADPRRGGADGRAGRGHRGERPPGVGDRGGDDPPACCSSTKWSGRSPARPAGRTTAAFPPGCWARC